MGVVHFGCRLICNISNVLSSPECCAWHGYDYQVVTNDSDGNDYIVCVENLNSPSTELNTGEIQPSYPYITVTGSTTYNEFSNPAGDVNGFYTTDVNRDCLNEALIITGTIPLNSSNFIQYLTLFFRHKHLIH